MFQINLVPEIRIEQEKINRLNRYITEATIAVSVILGVIIIALLSVNVYQRQRISNLNEKTDKIENELKAYAEIEETVNSLESGINEIKQIQSSGENWSSFFNNLEKVTPNDVRFVTLSVSGNSVKASLEGSSVESIDRFIKSLGTYKVEGGDVALFSDIVVTGYTKNEDGGYAFGAQFNFLKELL